MNNRLETKIKSAEGFQYSVNIQYDLENEIKLKSYIPLAQNTELMRSILYSLNRENTEKTRLLIGAYGTGKSHFCAILLALLTRPASLSDAFYNIMAERFSKIDAKCGQLIKELTNERPFFPVIVNGANQSFEQSLLRALAKSLRVACLENCLPKTAYRAASEQVKLWRSQYQNAANRFEDELKNAGMDLESWQKGMELYNEDSMRLFEIVYPRITQGVKFEPLLHGEVHEMYESVSIELQKHGYRGIYVIFDEFGICLEEQWSKRNGGSLKKIQDFVEMCNASDDRMIYSMFITHKPISQYAAKYGTDVINEWRKIEGRFKIHELYSTSNNTYELISRVIEKDPEYWAEYKSFQSSNFNIVAQEISKTRLYSELGQTEFFDNVLYGSYPLHPITTFCLPRFSALVAQNERTIFTFLSTNDHNTLGQYLHERGLHDFDLLTIDKLYDYFEPQLRAVDADERLKRVWLSTSESLSRLSSDEKDETSLLKAIGVLQIISLPAILPVTQSILQLAFLGTNLHGERYDHAIKKLLNKGILFEGGNSGTLEVVDPGELQLDEELDSWLLKRKAQFSFWESLNDRHQPQYVLAKQYNDEFRMTRYFTCQYLSAFDVVRTLDSSEYKEQGNGDGKIYYVIPQTVEEKHDIITSLKTLNHNNGIWILPSSSDSHEKAYRVETLLREIDALNEVLKRLEETKQPHKADRALTLLWIREREADTRKLLLSIFDWMNVKVFAAGAEQPVQSKADLSRLVSKLCFEHYPLAPKWNNEMINKNKLSRPLMMARQKVVRGLLRPTLEKNLGLTGNGPDMAVYRTLLRHTGIVQEQDDDVRLCTLSKVQDHAISEIMAILRHTFEGALEDGIGFNQILHLLQSRPYGLRLGIIPIVLAIYLHNNRNELVLINDSGEELPWAAEIIDQAMQEPSNYLIQRINWSKEKSFLCESLKEIFVDYYDPDDISGQSKATVNQMKRWLMSLPRFSRDTRQISETGREFRRLLKQWNISSGKLLFTELPNIFAADIQNTEGVQKYLSGLEAVKTEIDGHYYAAIQLLEEELRRQIPIDVVEPHLLGALRRWFETLNKVQLTYLHSDGTQEFLSLIRNYRGENDQTFLHQLFTKLSGTRPEDWNDNSLDAVSEQFKFALQEISDCTISNIQNNNNAEFKIVFTDDRGVNKTRVFPMMNISKTAELLEKVLSSHLREFGDAISKHEKCEILIRLLHETSE